ncbi:MAG: hypothetical protein ABIQ35_09300, partial [Verrucomicrobiota bacterium]
GGCMGDGQHIWAAAEWALMIRNLFVREEAGLLIVGSGIFPRWWQSGKALSFGPTLTRFGEVKISIAPEKGGFQVSVEGNWFAQPPKIEVRVPGYGAEARDGRAGTFSIKPKL